MKNCNSVFDVTEASEGFIIHTTPVRLRSAVYNIAAMRPFASWLFVGKQPEYLVSSTTINFYFSSYMTKQSSISILVEERIRLHYFLLAYFFATTVYGGFHGTEGRITFHRFRRNQHNRHILVFQRTFAGSKYFISRH